MPGTARARATAGRNRLLRALSVPLVGLLVPSLAASWAPSAGAAEPTTQQDPSQDPTPAPEGLLAVAQSEIPAQTPGDESWDDEEWGEEGWDDEDWDDDSPGAGRTFFYKELVLSGFFSPTGAVGVPPGDHCPDHFELSPRPPGNYVGIDYVRTFDTSGDGARGLPGWLRLSAIDFHPRILFDRMVPGDDPERVKFAPQDLWLRFNPGHVDRLVLHVGQFVIPYGVNPILAPRQRFLLPLEAVDLGLKWDWGLNLKGPAGTYDWEIAATIGSGEAFRTPHLGGRPGCRRYLLTGRLGTPTYWDFQYGLSFLYGDLPTIRAATLIARPDISRWRAALDTFYRSGTYLMAGAQVAFGQDGFAGDERFVMASGGETADLLGYRLWFDWVVPRHLDLRVAGQFESMIRDLATPDTDDTALILELGYSTSTAITMTLDYRLEFHRSMGEEDDALFLTLVYYSL